jgi:pyrrolidone-carboxylate peptidase
MTEIGNSLFYALLHYVALRGQETWFRRCPPAGLVSRIGFLRVPPAADRRARMRAREAGRTLPLDTALRGVRLAIEAAAGYLAAEAASDTRLIPS